MIALSPSTPDLAQPSDRRPAVSPRDFLKLNHTLRRMNLQRQPAFTGSRRTVAQELLGAGVDLGGTERAIEPSRRMLARPVDQSERAVEPVSPGLLVPDITHLVAVLRVPAAGPEDRRGR